MLDEEPSTEIAREELEKDSPQRLPSRPHFVPSSDSRSNGRRMQAVSWQITQHDTQLIDCL